jgi:TRAP-type transport system small permease protein
LSTASEGGEGAAAAPSGIDRFAAWVDRVSERVSYELFRLGIYVAIPALVVLVSTDVTLRYVFNAPLQWARDVNGLLLLMSIFCALPHAWDRAYHIRMEVFYIRVAPEKRRRLDVLASVAGIVFFGLMAVQGARYVPFMIQTGETGEDLLLPIWPFMGFLAFCALVVAVRLFANPTATEEGLRNRAVVAPPPESEGDA